jgi:hypothetical protein
MDTFDFSYHRVSHTYPQNSNQIGFGGGYVWASQPDAPPQRTFTLKLPGFKWYVNNDGTPDKTTNAAINNAGVLDDFYKAHQLYATFVYPHPYFGNINVKFKSPLQFPDPIAGGGGVIPEFDLVPIEQP